MLNSPTPYPRTQGRKTKNQRRNRHAGSDCPYPADSRRASRWYSQQTRRFHSVSELLNTVEADGDYTPYSRLVAAEV